jgi:hypothetical protein
LVLDPICHHLDPNGPKFFLATRQAAGRRSIFALTCWKQRSAVSPNIFPEFERLVRGPIPGGQHRFEFVGKEPLAFWVVASLLFANTVLMLFPESSSKYILAQRAPEVAHWYADHSIAIQFVLLAALAGIFIVFRNRVRYLRRK